MPRHAESLSLVRIHNPTARQELAMRHPKTVQNQDYDDETLEYFKELHHRSEYENNEHDCGVDCEECASYGCHLCKFRAKYFYDTHPIY